MEHADRVDEVKTLERERRVVQIGLDDVNVARLRVAPCDFDCRAEIDSPDFSAILRGVIREAAVATAGVENFLAGEEVCGVRLHVVEKLLFPLAVHFREAMPFVAEAAGCFGLCYFRRSPTAFAGEGVTHRWEEEAWYAVDDGIGDIAASTMDSAVGRRQARTTVRAAQSFQQRLQSLTHSFTG